MSVPVAVPGVRLTLCLYIAGDWPNSERAIANLREMLAGRDAEVEVVDCLADPQRGMDDGIFVTPTLVRLGPLPRRAIVGDLSNRAVVLAALADSGDPPRTPAAA